MSSEADPRGKVAPTQPGNRRLGPRCDVAVLSLAVWIVSLLAALALYGPQRWGDSATWSALVALPVLAIGFALAEVFVVHLRIRSDAHTFSLLELPLALGLFFAQPVVLICAHVIGAGLALAIHRKQAPLKVLFNTSVFASTCVGSIGLLRAVGSLDGRLDETTLLVGWVALLVEASVAIVLVFLVISLSSRSWRLTDLRSGLGFGLLTALFTSSLGLIAVVVVDARPGIAWILAVPTAGVYLANWSYTTQRRRHEGLDFLYQSTKLLHQSSELETAITDLLRHACDTFNAEEAELIYIPDSDDDPVSIRVGPGERARSIRALDLAQRNTLALLDGRRSAVVASNSTDSYSDYLVQSGYESVIVAPMFGEVRLVGALVIANSLSKVAGFDAADARLAETLANHAAIALENGRLEQSLEQLRVLETRLLHQATHDPLTGLANRALFRTNLGGAIAAGSPGAVLFIDLDDFKTVNDSFGHATGDALLIAVAERLKPCVAPADTIARLGGDEFAILLRAVDDIAETTAVASRILEVLEAPAVVGQRNVNIRASIGIATIDPTTDPETLMRNADTAMYIAKANGKHRVVAFQPSMYESNLRRFNLHCDLQSAISHGELVPYFQPIVQLDSHALLGVEALVRWDHPQLGVLAPDGFLDVAKETGLAVSLDMLMLDRSCSWLASVDATDPDLIPWVNVNLSHANFLEPGLVDRVSTTLERYGLQPERLGIEITEDLMSEHAIEAADALHQLSAVGIRLALDDFGTGYSSLSHLRSLPVDVIKIAKPFVDEIDTSNSQCDLIIAIVALGGALDKFIVAEGIEHPEQERLLAAAGCQAGQGHLFARALAGPELLAWARRRRALASTADNLGLVTPSAVAASIRALQPSPQSA